MKRLIYTLFLFISLTSVTSNAATVNIFTDVNFFNSSIGSSVYDDYSASGYRSGDLHDLPNGNDRHSNEHMSGVLGETFYTSTAHNNANYTAPTASGYYYCAGCNGTFDLNFSSTSVTGNYGVYAVGLGIIRNYLSSEDRYDTFLNEGGLGFTAFISFGDGTTSNIEVPLVFEVDENGSLQDSAGFWGITSDQEIVSMHLGLEDGGITSNGNFILSEITIAASPVPLPPSILLFITGLLPLFALRLKTKSSSHKI